MGEICSTGCADSDHGWNCYRCHWLVGVVYRLQAFCEAEMKLSDAFIDSFYDRLRWVPDRLRDKPKRKKRKAGKKAGKKGRK